MDKTFLLNVGGQREQTGGDKGSQDTGKRWWKIKWTYSSLFTKTLGWIAQYSLDIL